MAACIFLLETPMLNIVFGQGCGEALWKYRSVFQPNTKEGALAERLSQWPYFRKDSDKHHMNKLHQKHEGGDIALSWGISTVLTRAQFVFSIPVLLGQQINTYEKMKLFDLTEFAEGLKLSASNNKK